MAGVAAVPVVIARVAVEQGVPGPADAYVSPAQSGSHHSLKEVFLKYLAQMSLHTALLKRPTNS